MLVILCTGYGLVTLEIRSIHLSMYKLFNINKRVSTVVMYKSNNRRGEIAGCPLDGTWRDASMTGFVMRNAVYISTYGRHMFDVLQINSVM